MFEEESRDLVLVEFGEDLVERMVQGCGMGTGTEALGFGSPEGAFKWACGPGRPARNRRKAILP